jgi:hypothetical protein
MQRIAVPMIGGMISSTLLTLIVIPAVFGLLKSSGLSGDRRKDQPVVGTGKHPREAQGAAEPAV